VAVGSISAHIEDAGRGLQNVAQPGLFLVHILARSGINEIFSGFGGVCMGSFSVKAAGMFGCGHINCCSLIFQATPRAKSYFSIDTRAQEPVGTVVPETISRKIA